jgi:hypothetical protein
MDRERVRGFDETDLKMWRNDGSGAPVVISNGLGAPPDAWSEITYVDSGLEAEVTLFTSTRPSSLPGSLDGTSKNGSACLVTAPRSSCLGIGAWRQDGSLFADERTSRPSLAWPR